MNLKTFDRSLSGMRLGDKPAISINKKTGVFRFNTCMSDLLGIKVNDKVKFYQDQDNPEDWYMKMVDKTDELGIVVRSGSATTKSFIASSTAIAKTLFKSIDFTGNTLTCQVAAKPIEGGYWAIITKSAVKNDRK